MGSDEAVARVSLFFQEGTSDKVYEAVVVPDGDAYTVHVAWGRRGSRLNEGTKAVRVARDAALRKFEALVREKKKKGYEEWTDTAQPAPVAPPVGEGSGSRVTGRRAVVAPAAQLLTAAEDHELDRLLRDDAMFAQQKLDGQRVIAQVGAGDGDGVVLTNRSGQVTAHRPFVAEGLSFLPDGTIVDGELVGDDGFWLFDVLALGNDDVRGLPYAERWSLLWHEIEPALSSGVRVLGLAQGAAAKADLFDRLRRAGAEGIVFKHRDAPYTSGRPSSGGPQRKYKLVKSADVVVLENAGNAYLMGAWDGRSLREVGKVFAGTTNASRKELDAMLARREQPVIEVRYLYATADTQLYQPVFVQIRGDKRPHDCGIDQLIGTSRGVV